MKIIVSIILIAICAFVLGIYMPWWSLAIAAFLVPLLIDQKPGWAFLSGFTALFLLWGLMSSMISSANEQVLAHKISRLILSADNPTLLILVTALLGALVAGMAALSGSHLRKIIMNQMTT
jgi:hypothetical protein